MIIVNTTFVLHQSIAHEIAPWIQGTYYESAVKRGCCDIKPMLTKVIKPATDDCTTYAMHIYFEDMLTAEKWNDGVGAALRRLLTDRWGDRALTFHTYLEVIEN